MLNSRWPHPSSPQSGTLNVLEVLNLGFLSQIRSNNDETFRIGPLATPSIIVDVKLKIIPSFKSPVRNHQRPPSPQPILFCQIISDLYETFRIGPLATNYFIFYFQLDQIFQGSSQEGSTISKPPFNQKLFLNHSTAELKYTLHQSKLFSKPFFSWAKLVG